MQERELRDIDFHSVWNHSEDKRLLTRVKWGGANVCRQSRIRMIAWTGVRSIFVSLKPSEIKYRSLCLFIALGYEWAIILLNEQVS